MNPFVPISLNRVYRLRLTIGTVFEYEQLSEAKLCDLNYADSGAMTCLLWLMMRREEPRLTLEETIKLMTAAENKTEIFVAARGAISNAFHKPDGTVRTKEPDYFDVTDYSRMAAEIGVSQSELWELTFAEFFDIQGEYIKARKRQRNELYTSAWYAAYFSRVKDMPKLDEYLMEVEKPAAPREMTDEEIQNACKLWCLAMGGTVVET